MVSSDESQAPSSAPKPRTATEVALAELAESYTATAASTQRVEQATRRRERAKTWAIVLSGVANVLLALGFLLAFFHIDHRASRSVASSDATLAIARGFQCQQAASTGAHVGGCPPVRPGAPSAAGQTQGLVDQIVWRIRAGMALEAGHPLPPRPADVPPSVTP